jgi:hypothetical protein
LKKLFSLLCAAALLFCLTGCKEDYQKETYEKKLDISVEAEPTSILALEDELTKIAYEYDEGGILTEVLAVFKGDTEIGSHKGTLYFTFCRDDEETERGTIVILTYNMFDKKVTNVSYEQGNGKFTETSTKEIDQGSKAITFDDIFTQILPMDKSMYKKLNGENIKLSIEFTSEGLKPSLI